MSPLEPRFLSPRVARVTHALMEAWAQAGGGPLTAAEVCEYDSEALTPVQTGIALSRARERGLADGARGLWFATDQAWAMRRELEEHVLGGARRACRIGECPNETASPSEDMCRKHRARESRHGDPLITLTGPRVNEPSYRTRHARVATARGRAKTHLCAGCCGRAAAQWAQIHGTDGKDTANYVPLCRKCHIEYDWESHEPQLGKGHPPRGNALPRRICDAKLPADWSVREEDL
jgi:hypothetical protein